MFFLSLDTPLRRQTQIRSGEGSNTHAASRKENAVAPTGAGQGLPGYPWPCLRPSAAAPCLDARISSCARAATNCCCAARRSAALDAASMATVICCHAALAGWVAAAACFPAAAACWRRSLGRSGGRGSSEAGTGAARGASFLGLSCLDADSPCMGAARWCSWGSGGPLLGNCARCGPFGERGSAVAGKRAAGGTGGSSAEACLAWGAA